MAPPQEHETEYVSLLGTGEDRVVTRFRRLGKVAIEFSVVYEALIGGKWRKVTAFDNAHDSEPHQRICRISSPEYKVLFPWLDSNQALTESKRIIRVNYQKMRANYLYTKHKRLQ